MRRNELATPPSYVVRETGMGMVLSWQERQEFVSILRSLVFMGRL